ncbi:MAG TPA: glycosyltransferase, partial [Nitrococcus sp.]|nr:glycosyltransferase [Nitrococcus sp.]
RNLDSHVRFEGFRNDLPRILPCLDLLVHPARMEGLGVALLQAAACGLPIVAGRAGGIPEIVRDGVNGLLVEPDDVPALAQALGRLCDDAALRRAFGESGREIALQEFSIDAMVDGNLRVYRALVARSRVME